MPAQLWPANLPQAPLLDGFSYQEENNLSAFQPEIGQAIVWPRAADAGNFASWSFLMTKTQAQAFRDFYRNDLNFGVNHIILTDHLTDELAQEWQIVPGSTPSFEPLSTDLFRVSFQVYRIPATAMSGT